MGIELTHVGAAPVKSRLQTPTLQAHGENWVSESGHGQIRSFDLRPSQVKPQPLARPQSERGR